MIPTIFIPGRQEALRSYREAIYSAGGVPICSLSAADSALCGGLLLPGGGLGLGTGMIVDIQVGKFLTLGPVAVWTPFAVLAVPALEAPVFTLLARRAYVRHEA